MLLSLKGCQPCQKEQDEELSAGPHGSGRVGPECVVVCAVGLFHSSRRVSSGGGVGAVPPLLLHPWSLSLLWNAFTVSLRPSSFPPGLIKHRWPYCRAARSFNHFPPRLQAPRERRRGLETLGQRPSRQSSRKRS